MASIALLDAVAQSQTTGSTEEDGRFDVSSDVFEAFDARLEELHWRETADGALLVGNDRLVPDTIVKIVLKGFDLVAEEVDAEAVNWRRARTVSSPDSVANPQFD